MFSVCVIETISFLFRITFKMSTFMWLFMYQVKHSQVYVHISGRCDQKHSSIEVRSRKQIGMCRKIFRK